MSNCVTPRQRRASTAANTNNHLTHRPMPNLKLAVYGTDAPQQPLPVQPPSPTVDIPRLFGLPLKYVSLITLAVQNAALIIIMHYSRVSTPPDRAYSAASAVLLNELLKGSISLCIALYKSDENSKRSATAPPPVAPRSEYRDSASAKAKRVLAAASPPSVFKFTLRWLSKFRKLGKEVFSADCWKLSIPAILYVIQNNLQFVAASNLDVATFQVTYQMKILTTAAFSVVLLRKKLSSTKWLALLGLAVGVGIVQIQTQPGHSSGDPSKQTHVMNPFKGFLAVAFACMTSGLAGVYFEMVLKGSQADLWVRNVQLSLFSLLPALVPIVFSSNRSSGWFWDLFQNFGGWAWATVLVQVFGGLVTAVVIKYSDNIMKGFATSLSIIISFLASVVLFDFSITLPFVIGASVVLASTWFYNQPASDSAKPTPAPTSTAAEYSSLKGNDAQFEEDDGISLSRRSSGVPGSPVSPDAPILGQPQQKKRSFQTPTPKGIANALGLRSRSPSTDKLDVNAAAGYFGNAAPIVHQASPMPTPPYTNPPTRPASTGPFAFSGGSGVGNASSPYGDTLKPKNVPNGSGWRAG